ncbi:hypothetical protein [Agrobacterium vitis]|uniref:Uncharacterized protein n=1 Tax=Agrobacterium vitis TaxID=373 RepID=A0AAE2RJ86_AGRVI|nr:hypothetical protein [Agrobacterium vitis]MBF2717502.1 hypothetical protein [Agrobacterium vitis]
MDIWNEKFSTGQVIKATGVSNHTLQSWLKRGVIIGHKGKSDIEGGGSPGLHRRFSYFNVMEIAVAKALLDCGVTDLALAFKAAATFSHTGDGPLPGSPQREPGMPCDTRHAIYGRTLLCVSGERHHIAFWQPGTDVMAVIRNELGRPIAFTVLDTNDLFDRVVGALGYHPEAVYEQSYPAS